MELAGAVLAVDGGGSRCRMALVLGDGQRWMVEAGPTNVSSDFQGACDTLRQGLRDLAKAAQVPFERLVAVPAYLGLAGVTHAELAQRVAAALPLAHCEVGEDQRIALRAALGRDAGAVAHCGTGSFFGVQAGGQIRLCGGWGLTLGDEASAAWLGRRALNLTLAEADGLRARSDLGQGLLQDLGPAPQIVAWAAQASPAHFGALARRVTAAAATGDVMAVEVMQAGAGHIAHVLEQMGWQTGQTLCLTGGLGPQYASYLPDRMQAAVTPPQAEPLEGAVDFARARAAAQEAGQ